MPTPQVVIITQEAPTRLADNAGAAYLMALLRELQRGGALVTVIAQDSPRGRQAVADADGYHVILLPPAAPPSGARATLSTVTRRLAPIRPPHGFLAALRRNPAARAALASADVIDLQWPTMAPLLPALRRDAPRARRIATLHDVASQGQRRQRQRSRSWRRRLRFASSTLLARRIEARTVARADATIVFSEKDRALLPESERVQVVFPPLSADIAPSGPPTREPVASPAFALFVGPMHRGENREALQWFAHDVWPLVQARVPDAELRVAGRVTDAQRAEFEATSGVRMLGFVEDLEPLYASAAAVIAPLWVGAGVKFKVVEALVRGVPVVGTAVAFEGIGDAEHVPVTSDTAAAFADALVVALQDPAAARRGAAPWQRWAAQTYSERGFARRIAGLYDLVAAPDPEPSASADGLPPSPSMTHPRATVVIPVRDGENGLARQLSALARQDIAGELEVVIADNGSRDRTTQVARAYRSAFSDLRVIDAGARSGVNHARNAGLLAARAEYVLLCDHDDEVHEGWAQAMIDALAAADLVGGRLVHVNDRGEHPTVVGELAALNTVLGHLPYATGANLGVRRSIALGIGGFDESFRRGHDEVDFSWRLQHSGGTITYEPDAVVAYRQRSTLRGRAGQYYHSARTRVLLWMRHRDDAALDALSARGALRNVWRAARYVPDLFRSEKRDEAARALGWAWGTLDGHVRYRLLSSPPVAQTIAPELIAAATAPAVAPTRQSPLVSVIIPVFNGASTIGLQLAALDSQVDPPPFEVIVVDNGSTDDTAAMVRATTLRSAALRLVSAAERGASFARNVGATHAQSDLLMFCDADDVVSTHWVDYGYRNFAHVPLWSGWVVPASAEQFAAGIEAARSVLEENEPSEWHAPQPRTDSASPMLQGGNFGITRSLFLHLRGFDQSLPSSFEDLDLGYRARLRGVEVAFSKDTRLAYRLRTHGAAIAIRQVRMAQAKVLIATRYAVHADLADPPWPALELRLAGAAARMPTRPRAERDWPGLAGRALFVWGVFSGTVRYRYLRLLPRPRLGAGLAARSASDRSHSRGAT
ncbi:glycosyltransferase [uncultured Microbacterium sp.]|uniref:glycosyltransferase n=1 Tax=uncultured Microbacterium sp. TaxID=191216 RepID=UPI00262027FA|nr:glycosyltransferase [uncultured Microbacterium sp.]